MVPHRRSRPSARVPSFTMSLPALRLAALCGFALGVPASAAPSLFRFNNPATPLAAASGTATLEYYDPDLSEWGPASTQFGKASSFGLPAINGTDPDVMSFPGCTPQQGYLLKPGFDPNGAFGETLALTSNYTVIYDIYYPADSGGKWRSLIQTNPGNTDDGDFFLENSATGGVGISSNYRGTLSTGAWHRIAISVRAAPGEGQAQRYIDGQFVGAVGTTGSGLAERFGLSTDVLLLTDENNETQPGYLSSFYIVDRAMNASEITALGGPHAAGANVAGTAAPAYAARMVRRVEAIGHRGGTFGSYPDNTLPALRQAFLDGAKGVEVDTRLTADGVAVCFHDETVDRTTNGSGNVADMTLADLKLLDAGAKYDPAFANTRVPTLAEALTEAKGKGIVYLDIKTGGQADAFAAAITASGFPVSDLWFWTPGDPDYAAQIRAAVPGAKILWGSPDAAWATTPGYFQSLRDIGVIGFSIGNGTNTPDLSFAAAAKKEGFVVEVYTINDPDTMLRCAAAGVDYMETDFPATVTALQPAQLAKASAPAPASASVVSSATAILRWVTGTGATKHRVSFGTTNPPPFVIEQTSDLYSTGVLAQSQTYYWKVDEVASNGAITAGDVWSFTTPAPATGTILEWEFSGSLSSSMGSGTLTFSDGDNTSAQTAFETTDDLNVPHIGGAPATFIRIPKFSSPADGLALTLPAAIAGNGGGAKVNRYSFVFDMLMPSTGSWMSFFNVSPGNTDDGDFFVNPSGALGIGALGYSGSVIQSGVWQRVIFSADLPSGSVNYYVDGTLVKSRAGAALTDGRFALFPGTEAGPQLRLLNDENGEMTEILISSIAFIDAPLTATQATELGSPKAAGIFYTGAPTLPPVSIARSGNSVTLTWPAAAGRRLQRSTSLSGWTDVPGTTGQGSYTEAIQAGARVFFRAVE